MEGFLFKVGDLVCFKTGLADSMKSCALGGFSFPMSFMVVGLNMDECPGSGPQRRYSLSGNGRREAHEIELMANGDVDVGCLADALIAARKTRKTELEDKP